MKVRLLLAIVFGLSQALVLTAGVTAQGTEPPNGRPDAPPAPHDASVNHAGPPSAPGAASTVALGQPGTSFRYVQTFGVTDEAYPADAQHLNRPHGLAVDSSDNLYVVEDRGSRVLKYNSAGSNLLVLGTAGLAYSDNYVFQTPNTAAVDGSGNLWVVDLNRAVEYTAAGTFVQQFPPTNPWESGSDNAHFNDPQGLVFDSAGRMYVSDRQNDRVQVFQFLSGTVTYSTTLGVSGVPGSDNTHFDQPFTIQLDSSGRLYVVDSRNDRVQRCVFSANWTCSTFFGANGVGTGLNQMDFSTGVAVDSVHNEVYIADGNNFRVLKCPLTFPANCAAGTLFAGVAGVRGSDNSHFQFPTDLAVDSTGHVYVADVDNFRVQKFDSAGTYQSTLGVTGVPYVADAIRINSPAGIAVAADGSLFVTEHFGNRAIKLDGAGAVIGAMGQAGVYQNAGADNAHLGTWYGGLDGNPAIAGSQVYVPDSGNNRIQIFTLGGAYVSTFGSYGTSGNNHFSYPTGVALDPTNGDIYVTDSYNQRVQVYSSAWQYKATLGVTGVSGSDNSHFNYPYGVAVDASGHIYVGDSSNQRVQKCTLSGSSGTCTTFAGETGNTGNDFGHLSYPQTIATDSSGRVYVDDSSNNRVEVFDSTGAYLTTIGGVWGAQTSQFRNNSGVAVDGSGAVYVTDLVNSRIQKFALGVPGWGQKNITGFGSPYTMIPSLAVFAGQLYAGTWNGNDSSYHIWRTPDGRSWQQAGSTDFGGGVATMLPFNNLLYAGTWTGNIWRSPDGLSWTRVISGGLGGDSHNAMARFSVYNNQLYGTTYNSIGGQVWRTADGTTWTQFGASGLGDAHNCCPVASEIFGGQLYFGVQNANGGAQVWRTDGLTITTVMTGGFGDGNNLGVSALASFNGSLYAAVTNNNGDQVWRSPNGTDWTNVATGGLGNPNNSDQAALEVFDGKLYLVLGNDTTGVEVWRSDDGTHWTQTGFAGFGSSNNLIPERDSTLTAFQGNLYLGVNGWRNTGGQVWQLLNQLYLPLVRR